MPIKHIVMFSLKDDCTEADKNLVYDGLLELPKKIPTISTFELGKDLVLPAGQTHPLGKNKQIVWSVTCNSIEEYVEYDQHEAHKSFIKNILAPRLLEGSRSAIQYEIPIIN